jgi:hypothetical protein
MSWCDEIAYISLSIFYIGLMVWVFLVLKKAFVQWKDRQFTHLIFLKGFTHSCVGLMVLALFISTFLSSTWEIRVQPGDLIPLGDWTCLCTHQDFKTTGITESFYTELIFMDTVSLTESIKGKAFSLEANLPLQVTKLYMVQEQEWKSLSGFQASPFIGEWNVTLQQPTLNIKGPWWIRIEHKEGMQLFWVSLMGSMVGAILYITCKK